ncbi:MAG: HNH endonuclease [Thermodesulfobacteriota bacterium]|nr:HNH endonuclease [Thermodesulfobacteriota bacterium]
MKEIVLTTPGKVALVDDEDYDWLNHWKWFANKCGPYFYASRHTPMVNLVRGEVVRMHRAIMQPLGGMRVDHVDMNTLNNQRSNLRICTHQENLRNRKSAKGSTSCFKGVCWDKSRKKWFASIKEDVGKQLNLGRFDSELAAAQAYNQKATELFGDFARMNEI